MAWQSNFRVNHHPHIQNEVLQAENECQRFLAARARIDMVDLWLVRDHEWGVPQRACGPLPRPLRPLLPRRPSGPTPSLTLMAPYSSAVLAYSLSLTPDDHDAPPAPFRRAQAVDDGELQCDTHFHLTRASQQLMARHLIRGFLGQGGGASRLLPVVQDL